MFGFLGNLFSNLHFLSQNPELFIIHCFQAQFIWTAVESNENADICRYAELPGMKCKKKKKTLPFVTVKESDQVISYEENVIGLTIAQNSIWWKYWMK